jgi:hypothetical protein
MESKINELQEEEEQENFTNMPEVLKIKEETKD